MRLFLTEKRSLEALTSAPAKHDLAAPRRDRNGTQQTERMKITFFGKRKIYQACCAAGPGVLRENAEGKEVAPADTHFSVETRPGGAGVRSKRTVLGWRKRRREAKSGKAEAWRSAVALAILTRCKTATWPNQCEATNGGAERFVLGVPQNFAEWSERMNVSAAVRSRHPF
jgi:hypothetical protein